jgi:adenylate cyclase
MADTRVERRRAAILAAEVAGYSRMVGTDEAGTARALRELRAGEAVLLEPEVSCAVPGSKRWATPTI